ncbi:hypothetical protein [Aliivibrio fischeri]|uniref:hypothetical protein n=1 Tax=Aliivibrio fischeri TaxID=668 RepID=UPI0007C491DA|nr:hypothetical protein [Aliivibrio fischeri]
MASFFKFKQRNNLKKKKNNKCLKLVKENKIVSGIIAIITFFSAVIYSPAKDFIKGEWGSEIALAIGSETFSEVSPNYVFFAVPNKFDQNMKFIIPMDFTIVNNSKKNDKNVQLSVRYEKDYLRSVIPDSAITNRSPKMDSDFKYELSQLSEYDYAKHRLESLEQNESFTFTEGAIAKTFVYGEELPFLFKNGLSINVNITTDSENDRIRSWDVRYRGVNVNTQREMIYWVEKFYGKHIAIELRKESGYFSYLYKLLFGKKIKIFAFYPEFTKVKDRSLYIPTKDPENYNAFIFAPYSWDLL